MKNFFVIFFAVFGFFYTKVYSQNLVPNPGFEIYNACVNTVGEVYKATDWRSYRNSPDYFNACSSDTLVSVPENGFGFQYAHMGSGYCGFFSIGNPHGPNDYREVLGTQLITPLSIGVKYYLSFFLNTSFGDYYYTRIVSNNQGILLSTINYDSLSNPAPINNFATFSVDTLVTDTQNWCAFFTSFTADSAYQYLYIGNFFDDDNSDTVMYAPFNNGGYYFVDDVCISTDSLYAKSWTEISEVSSVSNMTISPNPSSGIIRFNSGKIKSISVIDMLGAEIKFVKITADIIEITESGLYFIIILNERNEKYLQKVIVIK